VHDAAPDQPSLWTKDGDAADGTFRQGYPVLEVHELVFAMRQLLAEAFPFVWVRGEISGLRVSRAGHAYLTLKDTRACLTCVCFRNVRAGLPMELADGQQVLVGGEIDLYPDRGQLQLLVRTAEPAGWGALAAELEALKRRLEAEGVFDPERKRPLPPVPQRIGVVTSPTGAVLQDILNVAERRHPGIDFVVAPTRVQGDGAEHEIAAAVAQLDARDDIDAIIVARGGGSFEDLFPFQRREVVRAVAAARVPVVSAVGHETDITLCDLAADVRAPTPSAAAELAVPLRDELVAQIDERCTRMADRMRRRLHAAHLQLTQLAGRIQHPRRQLEQVAQSLDARRAALERAIRHRLQGARQQLSAAAGALDAASPLRRLASGYALAQDTAGTPVRRAAELAAGQTLHLWFADGRAETVIERITLAPPGQGEEKP